MILIYPTLQPDRIDPALFIQINHKKME